MPLVTALPPRRHWRSCLALGGCIDRTAARRPRQVRAVVCSLAIPRSVRIDAAGSRMTSSTSSYAIVGDSVSTCWPSPRSTRRLGAGPHVDRRVRRRPPRSRRGRPSRANVRHRPRRPTFVLIFPRRPWRGTRGRGARQPRRSVLAAAGHAASSSTSSSTARSRCVLLGTLGPLLLRAGRHRPHRPDRPDRARQLAPVIGPLEHDRYPCLDRAHLARQPVVRANRRGGCPGGTRPGRIVGRIGRNERRPACPSRRCGRVIRSDQDPGTDRFGPAEVPLPSAEPS